jgi:hypothetical protein
VDQIRMLESPRKACALWTSQNRDENEFQEQEIEIQLYLVNKSHRYDVTLTYVCANILKQGFQLMEQSMFKDRVSLQYRFIRLKCSKTCTH